MISNTPCINHRCEIAPSHEVKHCKMKMEAENKELGSFSSG